MAYKPNPFGKYRLVLENYRAIKKADVTLDGITVVAGINACGKSTLSKALYETFDCSVRFADIATPELAERLMLCASFLDDLSTDLSRGILKKVKFEKKEGENEKYSLFRRWNYFSFGEVRYELSASRTKGASLKSLTIKLLAAIADLQDALSRNTAQFSNLENRSVNRCYRAFVATDWLSKYSDADLKENNFLFNILEELKQRIETSLEEWEKRVASRDIKFFENEINQNLRGIFKKNFNVLDDDGVITDKKNGILAAIHGVEHVFYYDSPLFDFQRFDGNKYYNKIREFINNDALKAPVADAIDLLNKDLQTVVRGSVESNDDRLSDKFWFRREDGKEIYPLKDCANGIKGLGLLQLLLNKGVLTNKTVVFLDEPEAYLHPEWIVEYARLLVLINKLLGTRFFVATHNSDMVSAIRCISEKEGTLEAVRFYLAEQDKESPYQYVYRESDEKSIEPIFGSFAKALDKIYAYSEPEDGDAENDEK